MRNTFFIASGSFLTLALFTAVAGASEKRVNYNDLPPDVQTAAQTESQGATVLGYSKDVENGKLNMKWR